MNSAWFSFAIFMTVTGITHASPLKDGLNAEPFLIEATRLRNQVKELLEQIEKVRAELPGIERKISEELRKNTLVLEGKEAIKEAELNGFNINDCKGIFSESMRTLIDRVNENVKNNTSADLHKALHSLKSIDRELDEIKLELETKEEKDVILKLIEKQDSIFTSIDGWKDRLPNLVQKALSYLDRDEASELVNKNVLIPTIECLNMHEVKPLDLQSSGM